MLLPAVQKVREAAARAEATNLMRQVALGEFRFHEVNGRYAATFPELLPFVENVDIPERLRGLLYDFAITGSTSTFSAVAVRSLPRPAGAFRLTVNETSGPDLIVFVEPACDNDPSTEQVLCDCDNDPLTSVPSCNPRLDQVTATALRFLNATSDGGGLEGASGFLHSEPGAVPVILRRLDANGNGQVTIAEAFQSDLLNVSRGVLTDLPQDGGGETIGDDAMLRAVLRLFSESFVRLLNLTEIDQGLSVPIAEVNGNPAAYLDALRANHLPVARCRDITVAADNSCAARISASDLNNGSFDPDAGDMITLSLDQTGPLGLGSHVITLTVADALGDTSSCAATVTVVDQTSPSISGASSSPSQLWPPNHRMVDVAISYNISDNCGGANAVLSVMSNEPVDGLGDGDTAPDWEVIDSHHVRLRAERAGGGDGRIYTIRITATDSSGNSSSHAVTVMVPKRQ